MASKMETYGKKRSLLKSWSMRCRQRRLLEEDQDISAPSASSTTARYGQEKRQSQPAAAIYTNYADQPAGALSDDAETGHDSTRIAPDAIFTPKAKLPTSNSMPMPRSSFIKSRDGRRTFISPFTMHPVRFASARDTSASRLGGLQGEQHSQSGSQSALAHVTRSPSRAAALGKLNESNDTPSESYSAASPVALGSIEEQSTPSGAQGISNQFQASPPPRNSALSTAMAGLEDVQEKVDAMLAATEALKPQETRPTSSTVKKISRMVPAKVLSKMSTAWDRIQSKTLTSERSNRRRLRKRTDQGKADGLIVPEATPDDLQDGGPSFNHATTDESQGNLSPDELDLSSAGLAEEECNKEETAIATYGRFVKASQTTFSSMGRKTVTRKLKAGENAGLGSNVETGAPSCESMKPTLLAPVSPFDSEAEFEQNLEDGILATIPIGSSTPRRGSRRGSVVESDEGSGSGSLSSAEAHVDLARIVFKPPDDGATRAPIRQLMLRRGETKPIARGTTPGRDEGVSKPKGRIGYIKERERVKKHPSPSKKDLEDLEKALQRYMTHNDNSRLNGDVD